METTNVNGFELAYDVQGEGEPVLFIHGAIFADFLRPLAEQPAFSGFQRIRYHRRGYGESGGPAGGFDMQAADIVALLDHLEVDRAHLVGHSEGAMIALVLAASYPDRVRSLALLEPLPSSSWLAASDFADLLGILGPAFEAMVGRYQAGDIAGAYDVALRADWPGLACGGGSRRARRRRPGHQGRGNVRRGRSFRIGRVELRGRAGEQRSTAQCSRGVPLRRTRSTPQREPSSTSCSRSARRSSSRVEITSRSPRTQRPLPSRSPNSSRATARPPRSLEVASV